MVLPAKLELAQLEMSNKKKIGILGILYIGHALMGAVEDTVFLDSIVKQVIGEALEELIPALKISMKKRKEKMNSLRDCQNVAFKFLRIYI